MKLYANVDGRPELRADGKVYVFTDLEIRGDVDLKTGHVDFQGNILVSGTVQSGFRVKGGSLTANEILKAEVEVTGDLVVFGGIIGATVRSGGNVRARYIHDAHVEALGDVVVEKEIMDSRIETSGACSASNGHIRSCHIQAKKGIEAGEMGSEASKQCVLVVGTNDRARNEIERLKRDIALKKEEERTGGPCSGTGGGGAESPTGDGDSGAGTGPGHGQGKDPAGQDGRALNRGKPLPRCRKWRRRSRPCRQEIRDREKVLEAILDRQEKIPEEMALSQQVLKDLRAGDCPVEEEISALTDWAQAEDRSYH